MELSSRTAGSTYNNCNVKGEWRSIPNLSPHDRKMFPIHHATNKVSMFIMTSTKSPNLGQKSFQLKKSLFHDQEIALPQSALDWTLQIVWTLFDPQALWKFWGIVEYCQLCQKCQNLPKDRQKIVKYCQMLSKVVRHCKKKWWLIVNHTLWFQWWQSQPCWSGSWWRIPSNRWK